MHIALATSGESKEWYEDIDLLVKALANIGVTADLVIWDNKNIVWSKYDRVFIDSTWDYTKKYDEFLNWCDTRSLEGKLINETSIVRLSSNKRYLLDLQDAGLRVPMTQIVHSLEAIDKSLVDTFSGKVVLKPLIGADGVDTSIFDSAVEMINSPIFTELHHAQAVIVQSYIPEIKTLGEYGAIFINGSLSHCVLKRPSTNDFRVQHQYGGITTIVSAPSYTQELYNRTVDALGVQPIYTRLDFIPTAEPEIMEVEMIEPNKYLSLCPSSADRLAEALIS